MAIRKKSFPPAPLALVIFALYCFAWLFLPPCYAPSSYLAVIIDKHKALERAHSPKIIFVGGSNLAYGLDSEKVRRSTGEDVVNMGVSRLFGLPYCLEEIKDSIHANDTIVIVPEYENFYGEMNGSAYLMNVPLLFPRSIPWVFRAYATSPSRLSGLGTDMLGVLTFKWGWWRQRAQDYVKNVRNQQPVSLVGSINPSEGPGFGRDKFTASGDFVGHLPAATPSFQYMELCQGLGHDLDPNTATLLNSFNDFAKAHGARVVLLPPPLPRPIYRQHKQQVDAAYDYCRRNLNFPVLSSPERYTFSYHSFFNSLYHLRGPAREQRSDFIVQDLTAHNETASRVKSGSAPL